MHMTLEADYAVRIVEFLRSRDVKPTLTPSRSKPGFPCGSPLKF